jgi:hypothetical protein
MWINVDTFWACLGGEAILCVVLDVGKAIRRLEARELPVQPADILVGIAFTSIPLRITTLAQSARPSMITSRLGWMSRR